MSELVEQWERCSKSIQDQVSPAVWQGWLSRLSPLEHRDGSFVFSVPNATIAVKISQHYQQLIEQTISYELDEVTSVEIVVVEAPAQSQTRSEQIEAQQHRNSSAATAATLRNGDPVDPRFTFENLVVGPSNRIAFAAARTVAEQPGSSYNPLFIYGHSGLGKTHLLLAIGNYVRENYRNHKILYVTTETFLNDFVDSIRMSTTINFKRHYRDCDVLLIDDVQFMQDKEGLQEELFHTYNDLKAAGKQMVFASDRAPKSIESLEERLSSRLLAGLAVEINPPDLETRLAILRSKAEIDHHAVPDEVLEFIATNVKDNIRELEGALIRVSAFASLNKSELDLALAEQVLSDLVLSGEPRIVTADMIVEAVARTYGQSIEDIRGDRRTKDLTTARHVAIYLVRSLTEYSYPEIGRFFDRDHTTCISAERKVSGLMKEQRSIYDQVTALTLELKGGS